MYRWAYRVCAVLLCTALLLSFAGCQKESPYDKGFRIPLSAEPRQLDPQVATDEASRTVLLSLFEGLTRLDENGQVVAGAAADWEIEEDGRTYTFRLGDSFWSDGRKVTAADFVYGFRRAVDPVTGSSLAALLDNIVGAAEIQAGKKKADTLGVSAPDADTLVIRLKKADSAFLYTLAFPPFMPCREDFFLATNARYGLEGNYVLGNGPFVLDSWSHHSSLLLIRNELYTAREDVYPERVRYMIDAGSVTENLEAGTLDVGEITAEEVTAAQKAGAEIRQMSDTIQYLWFNNTLACLSQAQVRTALRDSIEWEGLSRLLTAAGQVPATGYAAPESVLNDGVYYRTQQNAIAFVAGGKNMAERLAAGLNAVGIREMPRLTVLCAEDNASVELARYIIQSWQKNLGLYFQLETVSADSLSSRVEGGQYQIALWASSAPGNKATEAFELFTTGAAGNYAGFSDASYDALAKKTANDRAAAEVLERALTAACPAVPLAFVQTYYAVAGNTEGIRIHAFDGGVYRVRYDFRHALKYEE